MNTWHWKKEDMILLRNVKICVFVKKAQDNLRIFIFLKDLEDYRF